LEYLHNSVMDKEAWARKIAKRDGIQQGLIGVLKAVEGCWSCEVGPDRAEKKKPRTAWQAEQVLALLPLLDGPGSRPDLRAFANLVSV
jgi:hypothetical protein